MSKRNQPERQLQMDVVKYLNLALPKDAYFWHTPNGGIATKSWRMILGQLGARSGAADLMILYRGQLHCVELKAGSSQSAAQKEFQGNVVRCGGFYAVCRSIDDVQQCLAHWGIPTVARAA